MPAGSPLPPQFVAVMREVLAIDGESVDALYFVGLAEAQAGHAAKARELWTKLMDKLPADSSDRTQVAKQLQALGQ